MVLYTFAKSKHCTSLLNFVVNFNRIGRRVYSRCVVCTYFTKVDSHKGMICIFLNYRGVFKIIFKIKGYDLQIMHKL